MLSSVEQAFVGREEKQTPLKTPAWEATSYADHLLISIKTFIKVIRYNYLNPLVLLVLLLSLNLTYFIVIRLLFVQTMTSLTLTPGSRSAANAVGHLIFY